METRLSNGEALPEDAAEEAWDIADTYLSDVCCFKVIRLSVDNPQPAPAVESDSRAIQAAKSRIPAKLGVVFCAFPLYY
jgi:hypothetical protein